MNIQELRKFEWIELLNSKEYGILIKSDIFCVIAEWSKLDMSKFLKEFEDKSFKNITFKVSNKTIVSFKKIYKNYINYLQEGFLNKMNLKLIDLINFKWIEITNSKENIFISGSNLETLIEFGNLNKSIPITIVENESEDSCNPYLTAIIANNDFEILRKEYEKIIGRIID